MRLTKTERSILAELCLYPSVTVESCDVRRYKAFRALVAKGLLEIVSETVSTAKHKGAFVVSLRVVSRK